MVLCDAQTLPPPLRHLEIKYAEQRPKRNNNNPGVDESLRYCIDTLRALELEDLSDFVFLDVHLGSHRRLTCLPSMKVLTDLSIQTRYLFSSLDDMDGASICERLPASLQRLTLSEYWQHCGMENPWFLPGWYEQDVHTTAIYIDLVNNCLVELANSSADRLPRLQWVCAIQPEGLNWGVVEEFGKGVVLKQYDEVFRSVLVFSPRK